MSKQPLIEQLDDAISRILMEPEVHVPSPDASLADLLELARDLRGMPTAELRSRLRAELERKISISTKTVQLREGFRTVTPYLLAPNVEYIEFLKNVFGGVETERTSLSPDRFHSEVRIGDSMLMVGVGSGRTRPTSMFVYVSDADETYRRAIAEGAVSAFEMVENYGDRFGGVTDAAGNTWVICTYVGPQPIVAQDRLNTITASFSVKGAAQFIDFLKRAFDATEMVRYDSANGDVIHAKIRMGDSAVAVREAREGPQGTGPLIYMYVADCDSLYERALRAGAKSIAPVADQPYGDRHGAVADEWGNQWYVATPL
jgi:PhnB protein